MDIAQMHVWFRQYAQQMGMQNVRAILPEQIDLLINTSIKDTINQLIQQNIGVTNDRIITDNSKIGQINAFSTLYKVIEVEANPVSTNEETSTKNPFKKGDESFIQRQIAEIKNLNSDADFDKKHLFIVDLSINYNKTTDGKKIITNYFPVRLIDDAFLSDTLNDFVLRPRLRTPIAVIYNNSIDLYIDVLEKDNQGDHLPEYLVPNKLRVSYVAKPAEVAYKQDLTGNPNDNVNCDLPEYMHVDVLKHAVDLYNMAISGSLINTQNQAQAAQQENMRNNYRNEGYPNVSQ